MNYKRILLEAVLALPFVLVLQWAVNAPESNDDSLPPTNQSTFSFVDDSGVAVIPEKVWYSKPATTTIHYEPIAFPFELGLRDDGLVVWRKLP